jgi:hypothetical protein
MGEVVLKEDEKLSLLEIAEKTRKICHEYFSLLFSKEKIEEIGHSKLDVGDFLLVENQFYILCTVYGWKIINITTDNTINYNDI